MGLRPFDSPRFLDGSHASSSRTRWQVDRVRESETTWRAVLAAVLVAASLFVDGVTPDDRLAFGLVVAFCWLPLTGAVALLGHRRLGRMCEMLDLLLDLGLLVAVSLLLASELVVLTVLHLLIVATYTYVSGRQWGVVASTGGVMVVLTLAHAQKGAADGFELSIYVIGVVLLAWVIDAAATDRRQASAGLVRLHEKSDAILTGVAEAVVVTSRRGRVAQWNRAAELTFGCPAENARGASCHEVLGLRHDVRELDCSTGCQLLEMAAADGDVEVWRQLPTGQRQPLLASVAPVVDSTGELVEVVHSFRDITRLKEADEAKTLFLATASHELKTPLTVIRGFSQMLLLPDTKLTPEERAAALRAIDVRATQLTGIVDRLLMSSRIDAGRIDLVPEAVDVVPKAVEQTEAFQVATGRDVELAVERDLPALHADLDAFATVLDHLLDNAAKYSPGGGRIVVTLRALERGVELVVCDQGVGMTEDQAVHCFDRFWQAEPTDVRRFGGTGIGLYIVRSLVEAMGGRVTVVSAPGKGSLFSVHFLRSDRLPAAPAPEPETEVDADPTRGEQSIIREYMRQLGVKVRP